MNDFVDVVVVLAEAIAGALAGALAEALAEALAFLKLSYNLSLLASSLLAAGYNGSLPSNLASIASG